MLCRNVQWPALPPLLISVTFIRSSVKSTSSRLFIQVSALSCLLATTGDFVIMGLAGSRYPGYRMLHDTESMLGATASPVAVITSVWWVILGFLLVIYGLGFRIAYHPKRKETLWASWLIIIYGIGEGMGSGIFPANYVDGNLTLSGKVHDALGGLGIAGMFILPLLVRRIIPRKRHPVLYEAAIPVIVFGLIALILFSIAKLKSHPVEFITTWKGLWQRLLTLNFYLYIDLLAIIMLRDTRKYDIMNFDTTKTS